MKVRCPKCDFTMTDNITLNGRECLHCMGCDYTLYKNNVKNFYKGKE